MARRTRGNVLLNAYMSRYVNDQAANVNSGQSDIAGEASQGAQQINAVPKNIPAMTDLSGEVYDSILARDKQRRKLYEETIKKAQEAAEKAQKAAEAAQKKAASARTASRKGTGGRSGSSASRGAESASAAAELPTGGKAPDAETGSIQEGPASTKAKKGRALRKNQGKPQTKSFEEVERELDRKQAAAQAARDEATRYAAQGGRGATLQSTDVGLASSYGAYAQARAARSAEADRKALAEKKEAERQAQQRKEAEDEAERKTTLANLRADREYMHQLAQPGVRLNSAQMDAVREYLDELDGDTNFTRRLYAAQELGDITPDEALALSGDYSDLKQKVSLGGLGQELQAFAAGIYNSVPALDTLEDAYSAAMDKAAEGRYSEEAPNYTETFDAYQQQNPLAGVAGQFAGNAALYGAANAALEGTALAGAAATAGGKAANALKSVPGVGKLVTPGTGAAIGNILTGQSADLALDTIPSLAGDVYDYTHGNPDGLTPGQIAANAAGNFGVNLAMNAGSEAIPALWHAGRSAFSDAAGNVRAARGAKAALDAENARARVDAYKEGGSPVGLMSSADAVAEGTVSFPTVTPGMDVSLAGEASARDYLASPVNDILGDAYTMPRNVEEIRRRAQDITGAGRQSQTTRQVEDFLGRVSDGLTVPDELRREAGELASKIYRPETFTMRADPDPADRVLRDYLRNTPIKLGDQEVGDLLYSSGAKNLTEYNRRNSTRFSSTAGVDWDSALQELSDMDVGVRGDSFDDLLQAVDRSRTRPEAEFDEDLYNALRDWAQDRLLTGKDSGFEDFLESESFNSDAPQYLSRVYDRYLDGNLNLPDSVTRPADSINGTLPESSVGAKRQEYPVGEVVPNRDYAAQAAARQGLDEEHAAAVDTFEHQVWTDKEAQRQALEDINTSIQSNGGNFDAGMEKLIKDLRDTKEWDKGNIATAQEAMRRLRTQFQKTEPGTPEFYRQQARYNELAGMESAQLSRAGQNLQAGAMDAGARIKTAARNVREQWAKTHGAQDKRITELQDALDRLRKELDARNRADMDAADGLRGAFPEADSAAKPAPAGDMDREFGEFLDAQGVKTDPTEQFNDLVAQVKKMCSQKGVKISDEGAKEIAGAIQNGAAKETYYDKLLNKAAGITDLSMDELAIVDDLYSKAARLPDSKERYDLEQQALQIMAQHLPAKSWFERFDNLRYLAMLGNTRTHARNLIGNVMMNTVTKAKDEVAAAYQLLLPKQARTRALYTPREMKQAARDYLNENAYSALRQGGRYNLDQGLERVRSTYGNSVAGRALQRLSDLNSKALEKEDEIFLQSAFVRSLAGNLTAKGYKPNIFTDTDEVSRAVLDNAVQQAIQDAKEATFRADNALTKLLGTLGNLGDKKGTIGQKIGYMATNGLLPFTKTPANILKTSLEYTPVGGVVEAAYRGATGKGAAAAADALAKGTVGTGLLGLGWYLADAGLVHAGQNEDTAAFEGMTGKQAWSVDIPGHGTYTIDWASPSAVPFLIGAALEEDGMDLSGVMDDPGKFAGQFADIMMGALDPVTEMSLLSSVNDFLDSVRYGDENAVLGLVGDLGTSYLQQFIPTAFGQVARSIDPLRRSTYGGGDTSSERDANYLLQSTLNKIPGLSQNAEPYIDQWGRTEANLDGAGNDVLGVGMRLAYNMLSPGYWAAENVTPVDDMVQGLYDATGDAGVIPKTASSYVTDGGEKIYFTPEEKTVYAQTSGQLSYDMLDDLRQNGAFAGLTETEQAEIVKDVYSLAKKVGGADAIPSLDYSDDDAYAVYENAGQDAALNFLLAKAAGNPDGSSMSETDLILALANSGMDDVTLYDTFTAAANDNSTIMNKARTLEGRYGTGMAADFVQYMANYNYAKEIASAQAKARGESASYQAVAESVLDQLGYDEATKRVFWQMTGNWSEKNNPY